MTPPVRWSVGRLVGWSVIISYKGGKLHFIAPNQVLVLFQVTFAEDDEIAQRHVSSQTRWNTQDIAVQVQSVML